MADKDDVNVVENQTPNGTPLIAADDPIWGTGQQSNFVEPGLITEQGKQVRAEDEQEQEEDEDEEEVEEPAVVDQPTRKYEDPGEYTPKDYSFDVAVYDLDGKNGRTVKINSVEEWDKLLTDKNNSFGDASALLRANRKADRMENQSERDKQEFDRQKELFEQENKTFEQREQAMDNLVSEMDYLVERGDMPAIPERYKNNWTSDAAKKNEAVKAQQDLINYMSKENELREKAGLAPETSLISAYKAWKLDQLEKEEANEQRSQATRRKQAGAKISGQTRSDAVVAPSGIAVGRAGNLNDLAASNWT